MRRRGSFNRVSSKIITMLIDRYGLSQTRIAEILGVDKSFVSRVKSAERDLSTDQLQALAKAINLPLGLMFIQIHDGDEVKPEHREIVGKIQAFLQKTVNLESVREMAKT